MRDKNMRMWVQNSEQKTKKQINLGSFLGNRFNSVSRPSFTNRKLKAQNTFISISLLNIHLLFKYTKRFTRDCAEKDHYIQFDPCIKEMLPHRP